MKLQISLAIALSVGITSPLFGQLGQFDDEIKPLVDSVADAEDIPPPDPIPASQQSVLSSPVSPQASPQVANTAPGGELNAYDFGVSVVPADAGMRVSGVIVGSAAEAAGVKPNDTIVSVNGNEVGNGQSLLGSVEALEVMRDGRTRSLTVGRSTSANDYYYSNRPTSPAVRPVPTPAPESTNSASTAPRSSASYAVPRTTYSAPQSYRYSPSYRSNYYRTSPAYSSTYYRMSSPYYGRAYPSSYYRSRPAVSIGIGVGSSGYGRGGYGRGFGGYGGYGRGYGGFGGYGSGFGYGPVYGRGRSGVGISIGGIGIRF